MADKEILRTAWRDKPADTTAPAQWGRAAEKLRSLKPYRDAATVFATPDASLHQARINCLVDGKNLVMPAPSLREGFFFLEARSVPFGKINTAVTYRGLAKNGRLLKISAIAGLSVQLLLTASLAVDQEGGRIGDGSGFFDLSCGLLQELHGLHRKWTAWTFIRENQISRLELPQDPWDTKMSGAITPSGIHAFEPQRLQPRIFWEALAENRIKRINPLWKLYEERRTK
jgi:5-formyltetrahydrofolate cyclo-ligase